MPTADGHARALHAEIGGRRGIIRKAALWSLCRIRHNAHSSGHPSRLNRATLNEYYRFGDVSYAKEELRAELASVFLAAERGIPHDPEQHAAYLGAWIKTLNEDKHEIFRAAHDASRAADFLLALERNRYISSEVSPAATGLKATELGAAPLMVSEREMANHEHRREGQKAGLAPPAAGTSGEVIMRENQECGRTRGLGRQR